MAVKIHASADDRVEVVCVCDEDIVAANPPDALAAYSRDGDLAHLAIPATASRFVVAPLSPSARVVAMRDAGPLPQSVLDCQARLAALTAAGQGDAQMVDADRGALLDLEVWKLGKAAALLRYGLKSVSDFPGVVPAKRGAHEVFPDAQVERLDIAARRELADHIDRISGVPTEGKASSASPSGVPSKAGTPSRAGSAKRRGSAL